MSVVDNLNLIKSCKEDIKQAIIDKGVDMNGVSLSGYATKISEIETGGGSGDYLDMRANLSTYYSTVESVHDYAFYSCSSLQSVNLPMCSCIDTHAFEKCISLQSVNLPMCSLVRESAFYSCYSLQSVNLPMCRLVGGCAFTSCSSLQSVNLPMCSLVGRMAFDNCKSLQSVNLPVCLSVSYSTFYYCSSLQSVNLPMCSLVGSYAFTSCSSLMSIDLPVCLSVSASAFLRCSSLQSVNIPVCSYINNYAFTSCSSLSVLDLRSTYSCVLSNSNAFTSTPFASGIGSIYVHAALLSQFQNATNWTYFSECFVGVGDATKPLLAFDNGKVYGDTTVLHSGWTSYLGIASSSELSVDLPMCSLVGGFAFAYCSSLTSVNLPMCSYVDEFAFSGCQSLTTVNLPMCSYVGRYVFQRCYSLTTLTIGTGISTVCIMDGYPNWGENTLIFVPLSLVDAYKSARYWSNYASHIFGI